MKKLLTMAGLACAGQSASAALLTYEGFDYTSGTSLAPTGATTPTGGATNGLSGGTGWSTTTTGFPNGTWQMSANNQPTPTVAANGLTYTDGSGHTLTTSGKAAYLNNTTHTGVIRKLSNTYSFANQGASTIWVSSLFQYVGPGGATTPGTDGKYQQLSLYNAANGAVVNVGKLNATDGTPAGTNGSYLYLNTKGNNSTVPVTNLSLLVLKVDFISTTTTNYSLYINPTLGGATPVGGSLLTATAGAIDVTSLRIQGSSTGYIDELRVGNTFADVTPTPEPAAMTVLGGLGLLSLARRRRSTVA
jgi:MYXO-CTERM domain-containing protein